MGEVYRARDAKLGREVAIKILPKLFASVPDRLARFEREARVLASLNHPHIGAIYGLEEADGVRALVLELVEGETLADRLARGPIPLTDALAIARQMPMRLEAAQERGIIHRDLKPANIKIRRTARSRCSISASRKSWIRAELPPSIDLSRAILTAPDAIIGTTPYMSPEQARGAEVTRQSDVWAFGAVLFEMLTGTRAFTGQTTADVLAAILQGTPDVSALPSNTPLAIARLIRRCLERDPKARLRDIGDARLEIEDVERALRGSSMRQNIAAARSGGTTVAPQHSRMGGDDRNRYAGDGCLHVRAGHRARPAGDSSTAVPTGGHALRQRTGGVARWPSDRVCRRARCRWHCTALAAAVRRRGSN